MDKKKLYAPPSKKKRNTLLRCGIAILIILLVAIAVLIPVYFKIIRSKTLASNNGSGGRDGKVPITGRDGSTVVLTEGGTMTYVNKFGGYWVEDPSNPFDNSARPQSWSKPLNESWDYSVDKIRG
jgi:glucan 1,3-beta-glucosidase